MASDTYITKKSPPALVLRSSLVAMSLEDTARLLEKIKPLTDDPSAKVHGNSIYTVELANKIALLIAQGLSLTSISEMPDMPSAPTIYSWLFSKDEFVNLYARAKQAQQDVYAEQIFDISNTPCPGEKVTVKGDGSVETVTYDMIEHRKLQIEARKWLMSKLKPKVYGDSMAIKSESSINITVSTGLPIADGLPVLEAEIISAGIGAEDMLTSGILPVIAAEKKPVE